MNSCYQCNYGAQANRSTPCKDCKDRDKWVNVRPYKPDATKQEAAKALDSLETFMPVSQFRAIRHNFFGEEKQHFYNKAAEMADRIKSMPVTYEQDGKGNQAIVYLHYFNRAFDWYITEKDIEQEQRQAFGLADMGCPEIGYISIIELVQNGAELDLYFEPKTLKEIQEA